MPHCPDCGFPYTRENMPEICLKCDFDLFGHRAEQPLVIDLAHHNETVSQALHKLERAMNDCLWHEHSTLIVIHGRGSSTGGRSAIRPAVLKKLDEYARRYDATLSPEPNNPGAHRLVFP